MVAGRMLETFSGACVKENTSLTLQSAGHDFTARGSIMVETAYCCLATLCQKLQYQVPEELSNYHKPALVLP